MEKYDPRLPLVSIHVPKTAGRSLRVILEGWFGPQLYKHYPRRRRRMPPVAGLGPGDCIHGHFPRWRGFSLEQRVPGQTQFIAFLRNPLDIMISNYNYWRGQRKPISGPDHYLRKFGSFMLDHLPAGITKENYKEILGDFVFIGVVEEMNQSVKGLAQALGKPAPPTIPVANKSIFHKRPTEEAAQDWVERHPLEFEIWEWALANLKG
ncbi:MAG: hypothetical protein ACYTBJ_00240 [Planctomycetota bacterium]